MKALKTMFQDVVGSPQKNRDVCVLPATEPQIIEYDQRHEPVRSIAPIDPIQEVDDAEYKAYVHECLHLFGNDNNKYHICRIAKQRKHYSKRISDDDKSYSTVFGEKTSFDTYEPGHGNLAIGVGGMKYGLCVVDDATGFMSFHPNKNKDAHAVSEGILDHFGKSINKAQTFYSDSAPTFKKVAKLLRIPTRYSTPYTPTANSRQETSMRLLVDGIKTPLYSAGLTGAWWPSAGKYFCLAWNLLKVHSRTNKTAYQSRYPGSKLLSIMPFGCRCTFVPVTYVASKTQNSNQQRKPEPRGKEAILLGYYQPPGEPFTGEVIIAPLDNFLDNKNSMKTVTTRDVRFHDIVYPLRELRLKQQQERYNLANVPLTEEQHRTMIFGPLEEKQGEKVFDQYANKSLLMDDQEEINVMDRELLVVPEVLMESGPGSSETPSINNPSVSVKDVCSNHERVEPMTIKPIPVETNQEGKPNQKILDAIARANKDAEKASKASEFFRMKRMERLAKAIPSIVEFACSDNSKISQYAMKNNIHAIRLTRETTDLTTSQGLSKAMRMVQVAPKPIHLHGSLPCTPWSRWNVFNMSKLGYEFRQKIEKERTVSLVMLMNFRILADHVLKRGAQSHSNGPCTLR